MRKTNKADVTDQNILVDTPELQKMLCCGRAEAVRIGTEAKARIQRSRRVLWHIGRVKEYLDAISE